MTGGRDIEAGRAFLKLLVDESDLSRGLQSGARQMRSFGRSMGLLGAGLAAPFAAAMPIFARLGSELKDLSDRTGVSTAALSEFKFAAEQSGASLNDVAAAMRNMQDSGLDPARFDEVAASIAAIEDPTMRAQAAFEAFGKRTGSALLPMLGNLKDLRERARELGLTMDPKTAEAAEQFGDAIDEVKASVSALAVQIGAALAPALTGLATKMADATSGVSKWVGENNALVVTLAVTGPALIALGATVSGVGDAIIGLTVATKALKLAMTSLSKHPYLVAATVLTTLIAALVYQFIDFGDAVDEANDPVKEQVKLQTDLAAAMEKGTKQVDIRTEALKRLNDEDRATLDIAAKRKQETDIETEAGRMRREARLAQLTDRISRNAGFGYSNSKFSTMNGGTQEDHRRWAAEAAAEIDKLLGGPIEQAFAMGFGRVSPFGLGGAISKDSTRNRLLPFLGRGGLQGFESPEQVTGEYARTFGPRGTFDGRRASQIFGSSSDDLAATAKKQLDKTERMRRSLENIERILPRTQLNIRNGVA
jgi:hypothetical protein